MCQSKTIMFFILFVTTTVSQLSAAERKNIFADPQNLKVLDKNISAKDLGNTMKSFAMGLGLRCHNCHVGEPGKPLSSFDFAADDKELKRKARLMLKMVSKINDEHIPTLDEVTLNKVTRDTVEPSPRVQVSCVTCHRGQSKPRLIQNVLAESLAAKGIKQTIDKYKHLRQKYYGSHTFDFSESVLPMFAQQYLTDPASADDAVTLLKMNSEINPDSFFGYFSLAGAYEKQGDKKLALAAYKKAIELNPKAVFIKQKIQQLMK